MSKTAERVEEPGESYTEQCQKELLRKINLVQSELKAAFDKDDLWHKGQMDTEKRPQKDKEQMDHQAFLETLQNVMGRQKGQLDENVRVLNGMTEKMRATHLKLTGKRKELEKREEELRLEKARLEEEVQQFHGSGQCLDVRREQLECRKEEIEAERKAMAEQMEAVESFNKKTAQRRTEARLFQTRTEAKRRDLEKGKDKVQEAISTAQAEMKQLGELCDRVSEEQEAQAKENRALEEREKAVEGREEELDSELERVVDELKRVQEELMGVKKELFQRHAYPADNCCKILMCGTGRKLLYDGDL